MIETMNKKIILRFRDLITEDDGTINDHQMLINRHGEVWWGWWMKQDESPPYELFKEMADEIEKNNSIKAYLFNTGLGKIYEVVITKVLVAPKHNKINTPNPETSPSYYHRGRYPAWFLIRRIDEKPFESLKFTYNSFPTRPGKKEFYNENINQEVKSLEELKEFDLTMWVVN